MKVLRLFLHVRLPKDFKGNNIDKALIAYLKMRKQQAKQGKKPVKGPGYSKADQAFFTRAWDEFINALERGYNVTGARDVVSVKEWPPVGKRK